MKTLNVVKKLFAVAAITSALTWQASAILAYNNPSLVGNQSTGPFALGMEFTVLSSPVTIDAFGAYDEQVNGFVNPISVGIYDGGGSLVTPVVTFTGTSASGGGSGGSTYIIGGSRLTSITPFSLTAGTYWIVAAGLGTSDDPNWNEAFGSGGLSTTGAGLLSFGGNRWQSSSSLLFPVNVDGGPTPRYGAGTFDFVVPEASEFALAGIGLLGFVYIGRAYLLRTKLA